VLVAKIGVVSVTNSQYEFFSKFFVERKSLLRAARCRVRRAYADEVDGCGDKRKEIIEGANIEHMSL